MKSAVASKLALPGHLEPDEISRLPRLIVLLEQSVLAAPDDLLIVELERLFLHFPAKAGAEGEAESRWSDWMEDFSDVPLDCVRAAAKAWRDSKERWAPTPGQLKEIIEIDGIVAARRACLKRANELKGLLEHGQ